MSDQRFTYSENFDPNHSTAPDAQEARAGERIVSHEPKSSNMVLMNHSERLVLFILTLLFFASYTHAQPTKTPNQSWGVADKGVKMSISVDNPNITIGQTVDFYVTFKNVSNNEVVLKLGCIVSNVQIPNAIQLLVTDGTGKKKEFHVADKRFPAISGRMDDFLVPINPGEIYRLKLNSYLFFCHETAEFGLSLNPGIFQIKALFVGIGTRSLHLDDLDAVLYHHGRVLTNLWAGQLESNELRFKMQASSQKE